MVKGEVYIESVPFDYAQAPAHLPRVPLLYPLPRGKTMYLTPRSAFVRNLLVTLANGGLTLVILLIAPLGLAAVIVNTLLVMGATLATTTLGDRVVAFLQGGQSSIESLPQRRDGSLQRRDRDR